MLENTNVKTLDKVVVRFSGDSGDGMQLAGNIFTNVSAGLGNQVSTFPDYPAEIRAPQGSLGGVSGFQVSVGKGVHTPGDSCDVLISMNAAALKQNHRFLKPGGVIIVDIDSFRESDLKKANYATENPFEELGIKAQIVEVPVTTMTKAALADSGLDNKGILKCRNIFALGRLRLRPQYPCLSIYLPRRDRRPQARYLHRHQRQHRHRMGPYHGVREVRTSALPRFLPHNPGYRYTPRACKAQGSRRESMPDGR